MESVTQENGSVPQEHDIEAPVTIFVSSDTTFVSAVPPPILPLFETPDCMYRVEAMARFTEIARAANRDALPKIGRTTHSLQALGTYRNDWGALCGGVTDDLNIAVRGCAHILKYSLPEPMKAAALVTLIEIHAALEKYFRTHPKERIAVFLPGVKRH